jgi:hypothetical protein
VEHIVIKKPLGEIMFENNWYLFLLIVFLVFSGDGALSSTEIAVMGAILLALTLTSNDGNCCCGTV